MSNLTELLEIVLNEIDFARESDNTIESITEADEFSRRLILATI